MEDHYFLELNEKLFQIVKLLEAVHFPDKAKEDKDNPYREDLFKVGAQERWLK